MRILLLIMGLVDLNAAIILVAIIFNIAVPVNILVFFSIGLFLKGCIGITDPGSIIDFGILILLTLSIFFNIPSWILILGAVLIGFKAIRSFGI